MMPEALPPPLEGRVADTGDIRRKLALAAVLPSLLAVGTVLLAFWGGSRPLADAAGAANRVNALGWTLCGVGVGGILLAVAIARGLIGRALSPLDDLHAATTRLADGDYSTPIAPRDDEYRQMAADLERLRRSLDRQISTLAELDQMKSDFLGLASHELRTPVAIIQGCVELLSLEPPEELRPGTEKHGILLALERAVQSLSTLVTQVTDMTFLDRRRMAQDMRAIDLSLLADEVVGRLRPEIQKRGLSFDLALAGSGCTVFADAPRLSQALEHLLRNAIRFTPDDGSVIVRTLAGPTEASYEVQDTGVGVPPELQQRIFDPLFEGKSHLHHQSGTVEFGSSGLGLGLAICQKIVRAHRGRIEVESSPGAGSLFRISIPLHVPNERNDGPGQAGRPDPFLARPFQDWSDPLSRAA